MTPPAPAGNGNARFEDLRETVIQHDKRISAGESASAAMVVEVAHIRATVERIDQRTSGEAIGKTIERLLQIGVSAVVLWAVLRGPAQPVQQVTAPTAIAAPAAASTPPHHVHH